MRFTDAQSMLQLTIGLNLAYFTFRELRAPSIARREKQLAEGNRAVASARELFKTVRHPPQLQPDNDETALFMKAGVLLFKLNMHEANLNGYTSSGFDENISQFDRVMRWIAFGAAGAGLVLLYCSSVSADMQISVNFFELITALSLVPSAIAIFYYMSITYLIDDGGRKIAEIREEVSALVNNYNVEILPRYRALYIDKP